ncbi:hypothetical protein AH448_08685 [Salmonella enterica subsp. diarizonae]|uniref:Uncharacterized protein n=3 Tax=Salmonella enterica TaxID=28901 RepID=A0A2I5HJL5_SALDZ|nr:hypothetical protein CNQ75_15375 [Salmonella enterica subsp. diarizonae]AXD73161.1 hypothetical protein CHC34_20835 [Salmonella enterica]EAS9236597.1 hypothetical protein [Salmonella enterica subsp. enterica]EBH8947140.1 hypothetical protein [Salmonella enterica subsp. diarizonae serovar 48:i:z]EBW1590290.1 hypothetical protein [Salmonella enterica subsp. diarizonae serovar 61:r:z]EBW8694648.1 hypothetical protein [Salmonella enterica subsp. diarizonae serovar 16:z10:e,n,x,z15]ECT4110382.1
MVNAGKFVVMSDLLLITARAEILTAKRMIKSVNFIRLVEIIRRKLNFCCHAVMETVKAASI